jgi:hypothetical protein
MAPTTAVTIFHPVQTVGYALTLALFASVKWLQFWDFAD